MEGKCEQFGTTFAAVHENPLINEFPDFTNKINSAAENYIGKIKNVNPDLPEITEVEEIVSKLKNSKAPGIDTIHNRLLKKLPKKGFQILHLIIVVCFRLAYFPTQWKNAKVIPIPKSGKDTSHPSSYRPISLLSSISKVLERVMLNRIKSHLENHSIIPSTQYGFSTNKSSTGQLYRITSYIKEKFKSKFSTGMVLMDIEKAFDRVWHNALIYKMSRHKFPKYLTKMVHSFLQSREFQVHIGNKVSKIFKMKFGLPQGSILSPILYNIFTADIPTSNQCDIAQFADDTAIFTSSKYAKVIEVRLEIYLQQLFHYFKVWKIVVNAEKTEAIFFTLRKKLEIPKTPLRIKNHKIIWKDSVKYLGLLLDKRLTFNKHVEYIINKVNIVVKCMYSLLHRKSALNIKNKLLLYKVGIRPILTYGAPVFSKAAKTHLQKIQITQNKILKMILNAPWRTKTTKIHQQSNVPLIHEFLTKLTKKFEEKMT